MRQTLSGLAVFPAQEYPRPFAECRMALRSARSCDPKLVWGSHARFHVAGGCSPNRATSSFDAINLPFGKTCRKCGNPVSSEIHSPPGDIFGLRDRGFPFVCFMLVTEPPTARQQFVRNRAPHTWLRYRGQHGAANINRRFITIFWVYEFEHFNAVGENGLNRWTQTTIPLETVQFEKTVAAIASIPAGLRVISVWPSPGTRVTARSGRTGFSRPA